MMPLTVQINVALRKQICQKIGSERVKVILDSSNLDCHNVEDICL